MPKTRKYTNVHQQKTKQTVVHPCMEDYPAIKKNKLLIHATTWLNPKRIMLSESQIFQKATYYIIPFIPHFGKGGTKMTQSKSADARDGWKEGSECKKFEGTFWSRRNVLYIDCDGSYTTVRLCQNSQNCSTNKGEFYFI